MEAGIKPVYVFDGKAPVLKSGELEKRMERRKEAEAKLEEAKEVATSEEVGKFSRRLVRVTSQHNDECKKLLKLMGIPIICAPSEAEAQCAELAKEGLVYGIATEDMDGLTFGASRVIRHLSAGNSDKVKEFVLEKVLEGLGLTHEQFIDLCILMGCDYCESIKGVGGKTGLELIKQYGSIEEILRKRYNVHDFIDPEIEYKEKIRPPDEKVEAKTDEEKEGEEKEKEVKQEDSGVQDSGNEVKEEKDVDSEVEGVMNRSIKEDDSDIDQPKKKRQKTNGHSSDKEAEHSSGSDNEVSENETEKDGETDQAKNKQKKKGKKGPRVVVPENWLFRGARKLFQEPNVLRNTFTEKDLKINDVDEEGLIDFLVKENGFSEDRVRAGIRRVKEAKGKSAQTRIDSFFKAVPGKSPQKKAPSPSPAKGKAKGASKRGRKPR